MKTRKEIWIEQTLQSTENIQRIQASEHLFTDIQSRLRTSIRNIEMVPAHKVWLAAASIALLFALNFTTLTYSSQQKQSTVHTSALTENRFDIYSNS